jgi:hypothetical protein
MSKVRTSPGVTKGSSGAKSINPVYAAVKGVVSYVGNAAREMRDIPTAVGTSIREKDLTEVKRQAQEAAAAVTAGKKGTTSFQYDSFGDAYPNKKRK